MHKSYQLLFEFDMLKCFVYHFFSVQLRSFSFGFFCNEERLKKHSIVEISESFASNDYVSVLGKERIGSKNTFSPLLIWKEVAVKILESTTTVLHFCFSVYFADTRLTYDDSI